MPSRMTHSGTTVPVICATRSSGAPAGGGCPWGKVQLAGAAGQALRLQEQHALAFQTQPAAVREIGERLVHRLAARAHELGDLLLREVVRDPQQPRLLRPELP